MQLLSKNIFGVKVSPDLGQNPSSNIHLLMEVWMLHRHRPSNGRL